MVFYSRYYVQETLLVFFTLAAIASGWRYARRGSLGWAVAAGASFGLMHATKETWVLAAAAMALALPLAIAWGRWRERVAGPESGVAGAERSDAPGILSILKPHLRPPHLLAAAAAACLVATVLYSSFGTNPKGPGDSIRAYATYLRRGTESGLHTHPWHFYLELLVAFRPGRGFFWTEGLIVGLAAVGFFYTLLLREKAGLCRFLAFYTVLLTAFYSLIPYKTPWCMLSFLQGMILLAGVGAWAVLRWLPGLPLKTLALGLLVTGAGHLGSECRRLNFDPRLIADQRNPYVYAHTSTDALNLAARMERLAQLSDDGHEMVIHVVTPENYSPLPWYLRKFNHVGYWHDPAVWDRETAHYPPPSVILLTSDVQEAVDAHLRTAYNRQMIFGLRPTVLLSVYVREDLWAKFISASAEPGGTP
jgi:predicted membrane-bound mannosyltransferase